MRESHIKGSTNQHAASSLCPLYRRYPLLHTYKKLTTRFPPLPNLHDNANRKICDSLADHVTISCQGHHSPIVKTEDKRLETGQVGEFGLKFR